MKAWRGNGGSSGGVPHYLQSTAQFGLAAWDRGQSEEPEPLEGGPVGTPTPFMVAASEVPRNASEARARSEGRARGCPDTGAADNRSIIKAGAGKPRPSRPALLSVAGGLRMLTSLCTGGYPRIGRREGRICRCFWGLVVSECGMAHRLRVIRSAVVARH
jgi:hypothetical protein